MAIIEVRDLLKSFGDQIILKGVNLDIHEGDMKVVMGPSGSGKSTLLRCLNRLEQPTGGQIFFRGQNIMSPDVDVRALRQSMGFVFQQYALYRHLTVLENVSLALLKLKHYSAAAAKHKALAELERLAMVAHADKYPGQLSGGQKQRVAIARALAMDPAVVFFDEPTSALDPVMSREVAEVMNRLHAENVTMLCVTHDLQLAKQIADQVVFLDKGVVRAEASIESLSTDHPDQAVRSFFSIQGQD